MAESEVRTLVEGMVDAAVLLDQDRRVRHYNDAYARFLGGSARKLQRRVDQGVFCYELTPLSVCEKACVGCTARDKGAPVHVAGITVKTMPLREPTEELELIVSATPLAEGWVVESYRDVTAETRIQRRYRDAMRVQREYQGQLESAVEERTRDLAQANEELKRTQAQLVQNEKMSSLGLLVAGVAHEINNPVNFIVCNLPFLTQYTEALEKLIDSYERGKSPDDHEVAKLKRELDIDYLRSDAPSLLRSIRNGADRAAAIVADLRTFSRGGDGNPVPVDVNAGIEATLNLVRPTLGKHGRLEKELEAVPPVLGNAGKLNQVFMNLLTNAAQALPNGAGTVAVSSRLDGELVRVDVRDTGVGIPAKIRERIFDPFFTTKPVGSGTGLGLSISYSIVQAHGGKMLVESEEGRGSTFSVLLPRMKGAGEP